ncbi:hypothetical protein FXB39_04185 [Nocardioides sp. BGMRC 2183]|nr:hypothetical protein FXB39_04185 [Nocardioides sp. BGMRC 2183]
MMGSAKMRRAEEFDALVSGRAPRASTDRYDDLLEVVGSLRAVPEVEARAEFVADLRTQLVAAAQRQERPAIDDATARRLTPAQRRGAGERRLAVALGGFAVVAATGSMAMASQGSLPGDVLYPVKRAMENAETNLARDDASRASTLIEHAEVRLGEVEELAARAESDADAINRTLEDFDRQTSEAARLATDEYDANGDPTGISSLRAFSDRSLSRLTALNESLPDDARPALISTAEMLAQIDSDAYNLCPDCASNLLTQLPEITARSLQSPAEQREDPTLVDIPEITEKDLAAGETIRPPGTTERDDPDAGSTTDPKGPRGGQGTEDEEKDEPLGPLSDDPDDPDDGLLGNTVRSLTRGLGLDDGNDANGEEKGLLGGVVGLLGLGG